MNARKKGGDAGRSGLAMSKLFEALGHVYNPFSIDFHKDHGVEGYKQDESVRNLRALNLHVEMAKAEASFMTCNLIARIQKS